MEWQLVQDQEKENQVEIQQNEQLLQISNQILALTKTIQELTARNTGTAGR